MKYKKKGLFGWSLAGTFRLSLILLISSCQTRARKTFIYIQQTLRNVFQWAMYSERFCLHKNCFKQKKKQQKRGEGGVGERRKKEIAITKMQKGMFADGIDINYYVWIKNTFGNGKTKYCLHSLREISSRCALVASLAVFSFLSFFISTTSNPSTAHYS